MSYRPIRFAVPLALVSLTLPLAAGEWSRFRGPNGSGLSNAQGLPVEVGQTHVAWATEVPFGRSSPVLAKDRIFLTATGGGLVYFRDRESLPDGMVGHPRGVEWFCDRHRLAARELSGSSLNDAMRELRRRYRRRLGLGAWLRRLTR